MRDEKRKKALAVKICKKITKSKLIYKMETLGQLANCYLFQILCSYIKIMFNVQCEHTLC